jgi:hypothetical protein
VLRQIFLDPQARAVNFNWEGVARFIVGVFRGDAARAGAAAAVQPLVDELCAKSPDFAAMWRESEVNSACEGVRRLCHPELGEIALEFSAFAVDGRADLVMMVYTPTSADAAARIRALAAAHSSCGSATCNAPQTTNHGSLDPPSTEAASPMICER